MDSRTLRVFGLWVLLALATTGTTAQENIYATGCTDDEVILQCPEHSRIAIKRLFYGVKRNWECRPDRGVPREAACCHTSHTDCLVNDDSKYPTLNTHCSGYQQCKIMVQKVPAGASCTDAANTDYMTVIYDCVPEMDIAMFCSNDVKRGRTLFLSNVEYPSSVREEKSDCSCLVRTAETEGINIHSIDVFLAWAEHGKRSCSKELVIEDYRGYRWDIQCGHVGLYGFRTIYTESVNNVTLTLKSSTGKGAAFVWLQAKATRDDEVEIFCGEPLRQLLVRLRQEVESRHRTSEDDRTTPINRNVGGKNSTFPYAAHVTSLSSNLAAIIGGIVAAGFVLISIVIIAIAFHCRRVQQAKKKPSPINLYPAVTNGETTNLTSYCRYDYDDDHYSSINRSPLKMSSLTDSDPATNHARTNGFITLATAEAHQPSNQEQIRIREDNTVQPFQQSPPSSPRDPLLSDPSYNGHLSLRFSRPNGGVHSVDLHDGHKTLPDNRSNKIIVSGIDVHNGHKTLPDNRSKILVNGPKSPLGKRSKSVTFSQPVAMVTPLPSGSEESMALEEVNLKGSSISSLEDGNYDNLNKMFIPDHPLSPTQVHVPIVKKPNSLGYQGQGYQANGYQGDGYQGNAYCGDGFQGKGYQGDSYQGKADVYQGDAIIHSPQRAIINTNPQHTNLPSPPHQAYVNLLPRSLSTFRAEEDGMENGGGGLKDYDEVPFNLPPPPPDIVNGDTYAVVYKPKATPVYHPKRQNAQLYETGV